AQPGAGDAAVRVSGIVEDARAPEMRYEPGNPLANAEGYVFAPNVNVVEEMVNMISASRAYQNNVEVMNTSKELLLASLRLGQYMSSDAITGSSHASAAAARAKAQLAQDQFLQLMVAQLRYQDLASPMRPADFLGQLAQFGTVTGIQGMQG